MANPEIKDFNVNVSYIILTVDFLLSVHIEYVYCVSENSTRKNFHSESLKKMALRSNTHPDYL
jgi:hypothetical protein